MNIQSGTHFLAHDFISFEEPKSFATP